MAKYTDNIKAVIKDYSATGWKVLILQVLIFMVYLGFYALASYLFGDITTPKIDSFVDYLVFPVAMVILFALYLTVNGWIARKIFKWK